MDSTASLDSGASLNSTRPDGSGQSPSLEHHNITSLSNSKQKTRVRTGCLICRARKVKCDEQRPSCRKCTSLRKTCVYKTPGQHSWPRTRMNSEREYMASPDDQITTRTDSTIVLPQSENGSYDSLQTPVHPGVFEDVRTPDGILHSEVQPESEPDIEGGTHLRHDVQSDQGLAGSIEADSSPIHPRVDITGQEEDPTTSFARFQRTSQVIYLTLSLDKFPASEAPTEASFVYFIDEVDSPFISPFDTLNWKRVKLFVAQLGAQQISVAKSILAIQAIYRAQVDRLPMTHAMSLYQAAIMSIKSILGNNDVEFYIILINVFLLCLSELTLPNHDSLTFNGLDEVFMARLKAWLPNGHQPPVALRICTWLQLLDTAAKRGGSPSLLPDSIFNLLSDHITELPSLSSLDNDIDPGNILYDTISAPLFTFYFKLQRISNRVADVSHYRRSRVTLVDQAEVHDILTSLKDKLYKLWESRPSLLQLQPRELREHFHHTIASPLVCFTGICLAAYFAEFVVIGRTFGDPLFPSAEARQAMKQIRDIIDGDWNSFSGGALNPGYLRALFLYGVESFDEVQTEWAVDRLRHIKTPISRSSFFASFLESHGEAQRNQRRRVTMKYFCYQTFGVPIPFM